MNIESSGSLSFQVGDPAVEVVLIKPDGKIWVNPDFQHDEAAWYVFKALENNLLEALKAAEKKAMEEAARICEEETAFNPVSATVGSICARKIREAIE